MPKASLMSLVLSILPIVLIIALGYVLAKSGALPTADWKGIEILSFRVLIPAVLILTIVQTDMSLDRFGGVMLALILCWAIVAMLILCLRLISRDLLDNPSFTTIFQLGTRWNAFMALAAAEQFGGDAGLAVLAVAIGLLIPTINVSCIVVLSAFGPARSSIWQITKTVLRNPLVQGCAIGLTISFSGLSIPGPVFESLEMIGRGALAVGLMAVGAGISLRRLLRWNWRVATGLALRPLLAPVLFVLIATLLGLDNVQTLAGVLVFAVPAASNGYIVAKQMGGDADLFADTLTWQTIASVVLLPVWALYLQSGQ